MHCAFGRNTYYFLEYLSGDACKILTTRSLKNSVPALAFIHSHASMSGATINPARFVNVFPLPAGSNAAPSFNCVNVLTIHKMHWVVCIMPRECHICVHVGLIRINSILLMRKNYNHLRLHLCPFFLGLDLDLDLLRRG